MSAPVCIGLSGYARSGKDTLGSWLVEEHGFTRLSFADPLRECLYALNPLVQIDKEGDTASVVHLVDDLGWEDAKNVEPELPYSIRSYLQRLGTEVGRNILGTDVWADTAMRKVKEDGRYVFTDVRFPNEALSVAGVLGHVVRVTRPGFGPISEHPSETALDEYPFDAVVVNDGTIEDLLSSFEAALGGLDA